MKRFMNLLLYEVGKSKGMLILMSIVLVIGQLGYRVMQLTKVNPQAAASAPLEELSYLLYMNQALVLTMLALFCLLFIQVIYMWAREWRGQGSFIYRLMMLPGSRLKIYFAKLGAVVIMLLVLQGVQFLVLVLQVLVTTWWIPRLAETVTFSSVLWNGDAWWYLLPLRGWSYLWTMVLLLTLIVIWFQAVLIEEGLKSRGLGIMLSALVVYGVVVGIVFLSYVYASMNLSLTEGELYCFTMLYACVFFAMNVWLAGRLLERYASV